ncbi:hypothetical protein HAX54_021510 [Datura stramonium]|uniref:Uncharacterized protein n=1 Tax=Datura stramonium TaxID=4076 RepID=A0ABS8UT29_DATST|nr:hypothetical protein [Datura stramonium]
MGKPPLFIAVGGTSPMGENIPVTGNGESQDQITQPQSTNTTKHQNNFLNSSIKNSIATNDHGDAGKWANINAKHDSNSEGIRSNGKLKGGRTSKETQNTQRSRKSQTGIQTRFKQSTGKRQLGFERIWFKMGILIEIRVDNTMQTQMKNAQKQANVSLVGGECSSTRAVGQQQEVLRFGSDSSYGEATRESNNVHNSPSHEHQNNSTKNPKIKIPPNNQMLPAAKHDMLAVEQVGLTVLTNSRKSSRVRTLQSIPATLDESGAFSRPVICNVRDPCKGIAIDGVSRQENITLSPGSGTGPQPPEPD